MNAITTSKNLFSQFSMYLWRWLLFGALGGLLSIVVSPSSDGSMPDGYFWHVKQQQVGSGLFYGLICAIVFTLLQNTFNKNRKRGVSWAIIIFTWFAMKFAFIGIISIIMSIEDSKTISEAITQDAEETISSMQQIQKQAAQQHPGQPLREAMRDALVSKMQSELDSTKSGDEKVEAAAGQFLGYYLSATRVRFNYCKSQGVDISTFVTTFKQHNAALHEKSLMILARSSDLNSEEALGLEELLYKQIGATMEQMMKKVEEDSAIRGNTTGVARCQYFAISPDKAMDQLDLARQNPAFYQILLGAK